MINQALTIAVWLLMFGIFYVGVRARLREYESKSFALNLTLFLIGVFGLLGLGWYYLDGLPGNVGI